MYEEIIVQGDSSEIASCIAKFFEHLNESGKIKSEKLSDS